MSAMNFKETLYQNSPWAMKRLFADAEAIRRNYYRRSGGYKALYQSFLAMDPLVGGIPDSLVLEKLNKLLSHAKTKTEFFRGYRDGLSSISELPQLPLLEKKDIRDFKDSIKSKDAGPWNLLEGVTSGSTGTPVSYYTDKGSLAHTRAYLDAFKHRQGIRKSMNTARLSGIKVVPIERSSPPYWLYIDVFRQLQCSVLHINKKTVSSYLKAFEKYNITHGNGYATGWLFLAQAAMEAGIPVPPFSSILTDSEGLTPGEQDFLEAAFGCPVYQTYGLGEVDTLAVMCPERNYHIFPGRCAVEITDDHGAPLADGQEGNIVVTDLDSLHFPFIRYVTGDMGIKGAAPCACGWKSQYLSSITGRVDDYLIKEDGRKIGRLSHIMKPAKRVLKSQLVQMDYNSLLIRVVPDEGFTSGTMDEVVANAKSYVGDMNISWELADQLERTNSGKIKYVIRKFD